MVVALPFNWRILLLLVGLFSLAAGIAFCFTKGEGHFPGQPPNPENVKDVFSLKSFWIMVILFSMGIGSSAGLYTMIPLYLSSERGFDPESANFLLGLSRISGLFMAFASGWISDRIGAKRTIAGVLFFSGAATIVLGLASHDWVIIALFVQPLIATCFFPPAFSTLSGIVRPALRSLATSLAVPIGFLTGGGLVPMFLGEMGVYGSFGDGIAILGVCIMAVPFLTVFLVLRDSDEADEGC